MFSGVADTAIDSTEETTAKDYLVNAGLGLVTGAASGFLGGPGTASKHMQSAFQTAFRNGNWHYYLTQVGKEAIRSGKQAIPSIMKASIPTILKELLK